MLGWGGEPALDSSSRLHAGCRDGFSSPMEPHRCWGDVFNGVWLSLSALSCMSWFEGRAHVCLCVGACVSLFQGQNILFPQIRMRWEQNHALTFRRSSLGCCLHGLVEKGGLQVGWCWGPLAVPPPGLERWECHSPILLPSTPKPFSVWGCP